MNINQLEYFVATVRQKSYSVAAKTLFITPQAVSKAVGDLEKELQIDLLTRSGKEVVPTQFGELFYDRAIELIASFDDINVFVNHHEEKMKYEGKLTLAL